MGSIEEIGNKRRRLETVYPIDNDNGHINVRRIDTMLEDSNHLGMIFNLPKGHLNNVSHGDVNAPIILDSGASHHFFNHLQHFRNLRSISPINIQIADKKTVMVTQIGDVHLHYNDLRGQAARFVLEEATTVSTYELYLDVKVGFARIPIICHSKRDYEMCSTWSSGVHGCEEEWSLPTHSKDRHTADRKGLRGNRLPPTSQPDGSSICTKVGEYCSDG